MPYFSYVSLSLSLSLSPSKLTLEQLHWMMFDTPGTPSDDLIREFITQVQQYQAPITETVEVQVEQPLESAAPTQMRRMRMNTKFRTQTT